MGEKIEKFGERLATLQQHADDDDPAVLAAEAVHDRIQTAAAIAASRLPGATPSDVLLIATMLRDAELDFVADDEDDGEQDMTDASEQETDGDDET